MKVKRDGRPQLLPYVYRGLFICLIVLGLILAGGTIYGFFFKNASPVQRPANPQSSNEANGRGQTFTGIGRVRVSTADPQPGTVILLISFIYYPEDRAFSEELALRVKDFREIISNYIGSFSVDELQNIGEETVKTELLRRFNAVLRLGKIESLHFSDFMIVG